MVKIEFTPWAPFHARKNVEAIQSWLQVLGETAQDIFKNRMGHYPPPSSPGAWPNSRTGALRASIHFEATADEMTVGSGVYYAIYLRQGTSRMARRKMSDNALQEAIAVAPRMAHWVEWVRG